MMRNAIVSVMAGLVLCSTAAAAVQRSTTALALTRRTDALTEADYFDLTPPDSLGIRENAELLSAFLELHIAVEPGREVELWVDTGTNRKPWEEREDYGLRKSHWVADERTGSLVRLNVTELVRTWMAAPDVKHPKLLIRMAPDGDGVVSDLRMEEAATAQLILRTR